MRQTRTEHWLWARLRAHGVATMNETQTHPRSCSPSGEEQVWYYTHNKMSSILLEISCLWHRRQFSEVASFISYNGIRFALLSPRH